MLTSAVCPQKFSLSTGVYSILLGWKAMKSGNALYYIILFF